MYDRAIRGGLVIDESARPGRDADVLVVAGRVAAVEAGSARARRRKTDARGLVRACPVTPSRRPGDEACRGETSKQSSVPKGTAMPIFKHGDVEISYEEH